MTTSLILLQQATLLVASLGLVAFVRHHVRKGRLSFLLGLMWVAIATVGVVSSALIPFVGRISTILGLLPAAILAGSASVLLGSVALVLSLRISSMEARHRDLVIAIARSSAPQVPPPDDADLKILAVVPAFNEARSIVAVVEGLITAGLRVLVVNDGSTDGTAGLARAAGATVVDLPLNLGVGGALRVAFHIALDSGYHAIVQCDADGQHPVESVVRLLRDHREAPVDLLIGSRFLVAGSRRSEPFVRRTAMSLLSTVASRAARTRITDASSGLRIIRAPLLGELARAMPTHYLGDTFETNVMAGRAGYVIRETAVTIQPRAFGASSASPAAAFRLTLRGILVVLLRAQRLVAPSSHSTATSPPRESGNDRDTR